jgi:hypothetical protein
LSILTFIETANLDAAYKVNVKYMLSYCNQLIFKSDVSLAETQLQYSATQPRITYIYICIVGRGPSSVTGGFQAEDIVQDIVIGVKVLKSSTG